MLDSVEKRSSVADRPPGTGLAGQAGDSEERFTLRLYIAGQTPKSQAAVANLRKLCEEYLAERYDLEVVDLILQPQRARTDQILAIPTLIRSLPVPIARIIGDLSDTEQVLLGLNIQRKNARDAPA